MRHIKNFDQRCIYRTFGLAYRFMENLRLPIFIYFTKDVYGKKIIIFINENQILYFIFSYSLSIFSYIYIYLQVEKHLRFFLLQLDGRNIRTPFPLFCVCVFVSQKRKKEKKKRKEKYIGRKMGFIFFQSYNLRKIVCRI